MLSRILRGSMLTPILIILTTMIAHGQAFDSPTDKLNDPVKPIAEDTVLPARYNDVIFHRVVDKPAELLSGTEVVDIMVEYPEAALKAEMEATVYVDAYVDSLGTIAAVKLRDGGVDGFNHAAVNAVDKLQFMPAMRSGDNVNSIVTLPVEFELPEDKEQPRQIRRLE